jgi:hypothetical protein
MTANRDVGFLKPNRAFSLDRLASTSRSNDEQAMGYQIKSWLSKGVYNVDWLMQAMDVTQWGMLAATVVALGFLALKTRR